MNIMNKDYQYNYSETMKMLYETEGREQKAKKIEAILLDYYKDKSEIKTKIVLDVGSSTGIMTNLLSDNFHSTIGIDIDEKAVEFSKDNFIKDNLSFEIHDSLNMNFSDNSFDIVICTHIYEHVPNADKLMSEIFRVLKPEGICFFTAGNKYVLIEPHYKLPFLSFFPKKISNLYLRAFKGIEIYYETLLPLSKLKKLVNKFEIFDYTIKIIENPIKYHAEDMLKENSIKQKLFYRISKNLYSICPTYVWILRKNENS